MKEIIVVDDDKKNAKEKPISILIKEPIRSKLIRMNDNIIELKNDMSLIISAYLAGAGHIDGQYQIDKDFNFINLIIKENKENGKKGN